MCVVEFHNYRKRKTWHTWDTPVLARAKCDPVPPHGDVRSPKVEKEKIQQEKEIVEKQREHHSGGVHAWKISPVQREVVDVQIANRSNVLEPTSQGEKIREEKCQKCPSEKPTARTQSSKEKLTPHAESGAPRQPAPISQPNPSASPHVAQTIPCIPQLDPSHPKPNRTTHI